MVRSNIWPGPGSGTSVSTSLKLSEGRLAMRARGEKDLAVLFGCHGRSLGSSGGSLTHAPASKTDTVQKVIQEAPR